MLTLMRTFQALIAQRLRSEDGATAVEYGLMVALIAIVIVTAVGLIGTNLEAIYNNVVLHTALSGN